MLELFAEGGVGTTVLFHFPNNRPHFLEVPFVSITRLHHQVQLVEALLVHLEAVLVLDKTLTGFVKHAESLSETFDAVGVGLGLGRVGHGLGGFRYGRWLVISRRGFC